MQIQTKFARRTAFKAVRLAFTMMVTLVTHDAAHGAYLTGVTPLSYDMIRFTDACLGCALAFFAAYLSSIVFARTASGAPEIRSESAPTLYDGSVLTVGLELSDTQITGKVDGATELTVAQHPSRPTGGAMGLEVRGDQAQQLVCSFDDFTWVQFDSGLRTRNFTYNLMNQLKTVTGSESATYTYNVHGQLAQRVSGGITSTYAYDRLNRLSSMTVGGQANTYSYYGPTWMRSSAGSSTFVYDGHACVRRTGANAATYFVPGSTPLGERVGGTFYTYAQDAQNNITARVGPSAVTNRFAYDSFGNTKTFNAANQLVANTDGPRWRGETFDASTDQVFLRNRYYDPHVGRFGVLDPAGSPDGPNRYNYCGGDPVNRHDATGTMWFEINPPGDVFVWIPVGGESKNATAEHLKQLLEMKPHLNKLYGANIQGYDVAWEDNNKNAQWQQMVINKRKRTEAEDAAELAAHIEYLKNRKYSDRSFAEKVQGFGVAAQRANVVVDTAAIVGQIAITALNEPADYIDTINEIRKHPSSPLNYAGLIPLIPGGLVRKIFGASDEAIDSAVKLTDQLRRTKGVAIGGKALAPVTGKWLRGAEGNVGLVPKQVADKLRGRSFKSFDEFRAEFWKPWLRSLAWRNNSLPRTEA